MEMNKRNEEKQTFKKFGKGITNIVEYYTDNSQIKIGGCTTMNPNNILGTENFLTQQNMAKVKKPIAISIKEGKLVLIKSNGEGIFLNNGRFENVGVAYTESETYVIETPKNALIVGDLVEINGEYKFISANKENSALEVIGTDNIVTTLFEEVKNGVSSDIFKKVVSPFDKEAFPNELARMSILNKSGINPYILSQMVANEKSSGLEKSIEAMVKSQQQTNELMAKLLEKMIEKN